MMKTGSEAYLGISHRALMMPGLVNTRLVPFVPTATNHLDGLETLTPLLLETGLSLSCFTWHAGESLAAPL